MANAFLPGVIAANSSTAFDIRTSEQPPPKTVLVSFTVWLKTHKASWIERSASSKIWLVAPRKTIVHASPAATPENLISLSSPIIISSIRSQWPSLTSSGWSKVEAISPPLFIIFNYNYSQK